MADNVAITEGSGKTVSTEEVTTLNSASVTAQHLQRIIMALRTADSTAKDVVPGQATRANSLPVALSTEDAALLDGLEALLSSLATLLAAGLPAALSNSGNLKVAIAENSANTDPATGAKQTTGNTSLASIDTAVSAVNTKLPSQGQALAAASLPVVLPAAQITTLTPPAAITGFATETTLSALNTKVPASPAAEHTTAASPHAARLSDGSSFYKATTPSDTQPISGTVGVSGTATVAGTVSVNQTGVGTATVSIPGTVSTLERGGTVVAQLQPVTSGGLSIYRDINAGTADGAIKSSAGQIYGYYLGNTGTATYYFKFYDKATAAGTADTPVMTLPLFGTAAANVAFPNGIAFTNGIRVRVTTGAGDTDATTTAGTTAFVNVTYK